MSASAAGQGDPVKKQARDNSQVKYDPFSGETTITMPPQIIFSDDSNRLSMTAETKIPKDLSEKTLREQDIKATLTFVTWTPKGFDLGDDQLHFLADGEQIPVGYAGGGARLPFSTGDKQLRVGENIITIASLTTLQRVTSGSDVQMRLGQLKVSIDSKVLSALRRFLDACRHQQTKRNQTR